MIGTHSLTKRYGAATVVDTVDLRLAETGLTALIGPNGAGKSTLLSMIGALLDPDGGQVTIDGDALGSLRSAERARRLSILRQENASGVRMTVRELVGYGRFPHSRTRLGPEDHAIIERSIDALDLTPLAGRFIDELSGGQRQRAFIAMVLAQDTPVVLLDEPLTSLDLRHAVEIMRLLRRLVDEFGKRVVVVLHDINFAAAHADRIIAMRDGRVVADGPPEAVITPEVLEAIYELPVAVDTIDGVRVARYYR